MTRAKADTTRHLSLLAVVVDSIPWTALGVGVVAAIGGGFGAEGEVRGHRGTRVLLGSRIDRVLMRSVDDCDC